MSYDYFEFDRIEYERKLDGLRSAMGEKELDAVILTEEENIRWLSGYWVFTMQDGAMNTAIIVPLSDKKEPRLILTSEGTGEGLSWIKDIKYWEEGRSSYLEAEKGRVLAENLKEICGKVKKIGMELSSGTRINLDQKDIDFFRNHFRHSNIEDISGDILKLRSIKSDTEIEKLKKASSITCQAISKSFSEISEGITERSLARSIGKDLFLYGATGVGHIGVGFGKMAIGFAHSDPKEYELEKGMLAKVDAGASFEGYRCDMYRMACLGRPDKEEERIALTISEAINEIMSKIKDGICCCDLYSTAASVFKKNGFSYLLSPMHYIGHGIGLGVHEPPYVYKDSKDILSAGMVLSIEPWTYDDKKPEYSMNIEDVVLVTKNGAEFLTWMDREIYIV